jgi:hypothetical protein
MYNPVWPGRKTEALAHHFIYGERQANDKIAISYPGVFRGGSHLFSHGRFGPASRSNFPRTDGGLAQEISCDKASL